MLIFLYIYTTASALSCLFKKRFEITLTPSIFLSILILYLQGLATRNLLYGVYICIALAFVAFLFLIVYTKKHLEEFKAFCLTPGVLIYFILFAWLWYINRYRLFSSWDEFSHWGLVVKNMDLFNAFGNYKYSTVAFRGYPPAMALWQYFIGKLYGYYAEGHVYSAMGWLLISLPLITVRDMKWKDFGYAAFSIFILASLPLIFTRSYILYLYVDAALGIITAYILIFCFDYALKANNLDIFYYMALFVSLSVLCLTKASGSFLALLILLTVISAYCFADGRRIANKIKIIGKIILCGGLSFVVGKYSWSLYLKLTQTREAWNISNLTVRNFIDFAMKNGQEHQYTTAINFWKALYEKDFMSNLFKMTYITWICVLFALTLFVYFSISSEQKRKLKIYTVGLWSGLIVYTLGLLLLYLFTYSVYESTHLASFVRYLATYFIIISLFFTSILLINNQFNTPKRKVLISFSMLCALLIFLPLWQIALLTYKFNINAIKTQTQRQEFLGIMPYIEHLDYIKDKIYIISQNNNGAHFWQLKYIITPIRTATSGTWGWSLGKPYYEGDIWTKDTSVEKWLDSLINEPCEYVYLHHIDDRFIENYGVAFAKQEDIASKSMYKVIQVSEYNKKLLAKYDGLALDE